MRVRLLSAVCAAVMCVVAPMHVAAGERPLSLGSKNAPVSISMFIDYESPFVSAFWRDTYPTLRDRYIIPGKAVFFVRQLPLGFSSRSRAMAEMVACATAQSNEAGWNLNNVFLTQWNVQTHPGMISDPEGEYSRWITDAYRSVEGLNVQMFETCVSLEQEDSRVLEDKQLAKSLGIDGVPSFILSHGTTTRYISGRKETSTFTAVVDELLRLDSTNAFIDVAITHPHRAAIDYLRDSAIISGYADGTFRSDAPINRAEFTKIIVGAILKKHGSSGQIPACVHDYPRDVAATDWYAPFVCEGYARKMIRGYPDGTFRPLQTINLAEAAKIVVAGFGYVEPAEDPWYRPYILELSRHKAVPLDFNAIDQLVTRGQMAEIIYRMLVPSDAESRQYFELEGPTRDDVSVTFWGDVSMVESQMQSGLLDDESSSITLRVPHPSEGSSAHASLDGHIIDVQLREVRQSYLRVSVNGTEILMAREAFYKVNFKDGFAFLLSAMDIEESGPSDFLVVRFKK